MEDVSRLKEYRKENPGRLSAEQFEALEREILHPKKGTVSDIRLDFRFWCQGLPSRQEWFASYLKEEILPAGKLHILEVGSGRYPRLSVLLKAQGHRMTCMDPKAEPAEDTEIEVRKEAFDCASIDLAAYDFVVALEPCEAAEHIVRACTRQHVPFVVVLCGVPHELICGGMPEDVYEWYDYLAEIDPEHTKLYYAQMNSKMGIAVIRSI